MESPPPPPPPPQETKSESLPFLLLENGSSEEQPMPLKSYDPMSSSSPSEAIVTVKDVGAKELKSINPRRSPRFSPDAKRVSLKKCLSDLKVFDEMSVRRSPRFASSSVGAQNGKQESVLVQSLRRSPRVASSFVGEKSANAKSLRRLPRVASSFVGEKSANAKSVSVKGKKSNDQGLKMKADVKCLKERQSLRLLSTLSKTKSIYSKARLGAPEKGCFGGLVPTTCDLEMSSLEELKAEPLSITLDKDSDDGTVPLKYYDPKFSGENHLRRSPRFISASDNGGSNESFRSIDKKITNKSQLRKSPRFSLSLASAENVNVNSTSIRQPESSDERSSKKIKTYLENSDLRMSEEKFLRRSSRSILATENDGSDESLGKFDIGFSDEMILQTDEQPSKNINISFGNSDMKILFGAKNGNIKCPSIKLPKSAVKQSLENLETSVSSEKKRQGKCKKSCLLIGDPIPDGEAQERWRWRYELKLQRSKRKRLTIDDVDDEDNIVSNVECHYSQAEIDGCIFNLGDCAYIKGEQGQKHVGTILEFFKTTDKEEYFRVQWFYRAEDTVMKEAASFHDKKRLFYSTIMNDNPIDCIISKVSVTQISPRVGLKSNSIPQSDFYFDMEYCLDYSTFRTLLTDNSFKSHDSLMLGCTGTVPTMSSGTLPSGETYKAELALLDLYSGCGGMSTGLCLGAKLSCVDLVTRWALDSDRSACESLKLNHPGTHVWNEAAEDFLVLLKEWEKLCKQYVVNDVERTHQSESIASRVATNNVNYVNDDDIPPDEYEVASIVDICFGDPSDTGKRGLKFKVHWKGYGTSEDTWEPVEELSNCRERIQDFVRNGFRSKILPLPGDVDVICGGPPCQGISGFNRFRNVESPLDDERNRQIIVFMDIVQFLKPKFVLMENVVDILRFDNASLARYALSRLVHMGYQARLGTIAAGCYGLPQFRLRVFLWGAHPNEKLPQFPLPTHDVIVRYWPPIEFERNTVAYDENQPCELEKAIVLQDAISDLPAVTSHEIREEMSYEKPAESEFQRYIRSTKYEMAGSAFNGNTRTKNSLYDHRPYSLTEEDYARVCLIPKRKGANFRDLPGVVVGKDNVARREQQIMLPSGKPMVPDYAFTFEQGKSKRPFARLWWDETVPTVVTFPNLHSQAAMHPEQDRVLTIREYARLQGFPDYYRFSGNVKERYCQVGNAVAVPVSRALGYALGMAFQKLTGNEPLMTLPSKFSHSTNLQLAKSLFHENDSSHSTNLQLAKSLFHEND